MLGLQFNDAGKALCRRPEFTAIGKQQTQLVGEGGDTRLVQEQLLKKCLRRHPSTADAHCADQHQQRVRFARHEAQGLAGNFLGLFRGAAQEVAGSRENDPKRRSRMGFADLNHRNAPIYEESLPHEPRVRPGFDGAS